MASGKRDINRRKGKKRECSQNEIGMKQIKIKLKIKEMPLKTANESG